MTFQFTQSQLNDIDLSFSADEYAEAYRKAADYADGQVGTDAEVIAWLRGAADVNEGVGFSSSFIRGYTMAQYEARTGEALTAAQLQASSDNIAYAVISDILTNGTLPDLQTIANFDALHAAQDLFGGDAGGWAGNPLFLGLGEVGPLNVNVLETAGDTYDALAMAKFMFSLGHIDDWEGLPNTFFSGLYHSLTVASGIAATNSLLATAYGGRLPAVETVPANIILGRVADGDVLAGTSGRDFINGGGGDDTITGSSGADILDGSTGVDAVSYADSAAINVIIKYESASTAHYTGSVTVGIGEISTLFSIEAIVGSNNDDYFQIQSPTSAVDELSLLGGGGEDTLSTFYLSDNLAFDMANNILTIGSTEISAYGFEAFEGGEGNDTVLADSTATSVKGGAGDDYISLVSDATIVEGGAGDDSISFENKGTSATFVVEDTMSVEHIVGSAYADLIGGSGDIEGGDGHDRIVVFDSAVIDGGAGRDFYDVTNSQGEVIIKLRGTSDHDMVNGPATIDIGGYNYSDLTIVWEGIEGDTEEYTYEYNGGTPTFYTTQYTGKIAICIPNGDSIANGTLSIGYDTYKLQFQTDENYANPTGWTHANWDCELSFSSNIVGLDNISFEELLVSKGYISAQRETLGAPNIGADPLYFSAERQWKENYTNDDFQESDNGDPLDATSGDDSFLGNLLSSVVSYISAVTGVTIDLSIFSRQDTQGSGHDQLVGIDGVIGSNFADTLKAAAIGSNLDGADGDDNLIGRAGSDFLEGGEGADTLQGGGGSDYLIGDAGADVAFGGEDSDYFEGGDGADYISGETGNDWIIGGAGDDTLSGGAGDDYFQYDGAWAGNDIVDGGDGEDQVIAGADDTVIGLRSFAGIELVTGDGYAGVTIRGSSAADILDFTGATVTDIAWIDGDAGDDTIIGSAGNDVILGSAGHDSLSGADGDDVIQGSEGNDIVDGGTGSDQANYLGSSSDFVLARNADGSVTIADTVGSEGTDTLQNVEAVYFDGDSNWQWLDNLVGAYGTAENDAWLPGTSGDDHLYGLAGDDVLRGYGGDDYIDGGDGYDEASYAGSLSTFTFLRNADGSVTVTDTSTAEGTDTLKNIEALYFEADTAGYLIANLAGDYGTAGSDAWLAGTASEDHLYGLTGDDVLRGYAGDDIIDGGAGFDEASYIGSAANFTFVRKADGSVTVTDTSTAEGADTLVNIEALYFEADNAGYLIEQLAGDYGTAGNDSDLQGTSGNDHLYGLAGNDIISAAAGDDTLNGGAGDDHLTGGEGADAFVFTGPFGQDTVADFNASEGDKIIFDSAVFASTSQVLAAAVQVGSDVQITAGAGVVVIAGTTLSSMQTSDFVLA